MPALQLNPLIICVGIGILALLIIIVLIAAYFLRIWKNKIPRRWMRVGQVGKICCYPIRSAGGIECSEIECTALGLKNNLLANGIFLITRLDGTVITGRTEGRIYDIIPFIYENIIVFTAPDMEDIRMNLNTLSLFMTIGGIIGDREIMIFDCGNDVADWLSRYIYKSTEEVRLMYYPIQRSKKQGSMGNYCRYAKLYGAEEDLHDGKSCGIVSQITLDQLNFAVLGGIDLMNETDKQSNFVIENVMNSHIENSWKWIRIGDVVLESTIINRQTRWLIVKEGTVRLGDEVFTEEEDVLI